MPGGELTRITKDSRGVRYVIQERGNFSGEKNDERPPPLLRGRVLSPDWAKQKVKEPYHTMLVSDVKYLDSIKFTDEGISNVTFDVSHSRESEW